MMGIYFNEAFSIFIIIGFLVGGFHLYVRFFISSNVSDYNWLVYIHDFKYLKELKTSENIQTSNNAAKYLKSLKMGYVVVVCTFIAVLFLSDFNT